MSRFFTGSAAESLRGASHPQTRATAPARSVLLAQPHWDHGRMPRNGQTAENNVEARGCGR